MLTKFMLRLVKFVLGVSLALLLLSFVSVAAARYFMARLAAQPPRPTFANDTTETLGELGQDVPAIAPNPAADRLPAMGSEAPTTVLEMPNATPSPTPSPDPTGGYQATVIQPIGLIVRQEPNREATQITGLAYEQVVTIVGESPDGEWLQVQLTEQETGWIKSGNTAPVNP